MTTTKKSNSSSKRSARRIAILLVVLIVIGGGGGYAYWRFTSQNHATAATAVNTLQTAKATLGAMTLSANGTGSIAPATESSPGFNTSGQITQIHVAVGDHVEAGQVLAQLDDTYARIDLANAQDAMDKLTSAAAIATARQTLADAETNLASTKKTLEHLISPEVLYWQEQVAARQQALTDAQTASQKDTSEAAKQKVAQAETSLKYAQDQLAYFQKVYIYDYIPANFTQYQTIRSRHGSRTEPVQVQNTVTGEMQDLIYAPTDGEIGMAQSAYDLAKASIAEAQTYLDVLNGGDIPEGATGANLVTYIQTQHALETAQYNLDATKLSAPISGTVTALNINVGDSVATGSSVLTISNSDQPYTLDAYVDAKAWGQIQPGYEVDATFDIIPDQVFKGTVTDVYPTLDTSSSNSALIHFTARLNAPIPYQLPSGASVSVQVIGGQAQHAVLVPIEALHKFGEGGYALFVMENGKPRFRVVQVGLQDLTQATITSGLNAGDIVTTGVVSTK